jgi:glycine dehydrogenase
MLKNAQKDFIQRHIGSSIKEQKIMLKELGYETLDELISKTVPEKILLKENLSIGDPNSEYKALRKVKRHFTKE